MKNVILFGTALLLCCSCNAQTQKENSKQSVTKSEKTPNGNWQVHKEYDEQGNLVSMDSTYSRSWSSNGKKLAPHERDRLIQQMRGRMQASFGSMGSDQDFFSSKASSDSIQQPFFSQGMNGNGDFDKMRARIMKQMQHMQQQFFQQEPQPIFPREENGDKQQEKQALKGKQI